METTWRLRQAVGPGWVREIYQGAPIITADAREAHQWATRDEAETMAAGFPPDRVPVRAVAGSPFGRHQHGPA